MDHRLSWNLQVARVLYSCAVVFVQCLTNAEYFHQQLIDYIEIAVVTPT
jgi:hypothetical protein